jgi:EXS family
MGFTYGLEYVYIRPNPLSLNLNKTTGLGNPYARYPLLRDVLGFKHIWVYYAAMILDPILRFNWVFFAIFANDIQHSALLSFAVSLSEVLRRGMWSIFRMEVTMQDPLQF